MGSLLTIFSLETPYMFTSMQAMHLAGPRVKCGVQIFEVVKCRYLHFTDAHAISTHPHIYQSSITLLSLSVVVILNNSLCHTLLGKVGEHGPKLLRCR